VSRRVLLIGLTLTASDSVATSAPKPPRGDRIVFESYRAGSVRLYTMAPDGSNVRPMPGGVNADGSGVAYLHDGFSPSWSPNGRRIVFALAGDLYTMNSDGSGVLPLTSSSQQEYSPAWSPDGTEIAFVRDVPGPSWHHLVIWR
jgi:Tol biopolymer transport system component